MSGGTAVGGLTVGVVGATGQVGRVMRTLLEERANAVGIELRRPRPALCTDNGAMIAAVGSEVVRAGLPPSGLDISANSGLPVSTVLV